MRETSQNVHKALGKSSRYQNAKADLRDLIAGLSLPLEADPIRLGSSDFGTEPTAAYKLFDKFDMSLPPATTSGKLNVNLFAFRSALRSNVYQTFVPAGTTINYACDPFAVKCNAASTAVINPGRLYSAPAPYNPHGEWLYSGRLGKSDPERGWLMNPDDVFTVTVDPASIPVAGLRINVRMQQGREWQDVISGLLTNVAPTFTQPVTTLGYYSFSIQDLRPASTQAYSATYQVSLNLQIQGAPVTGSLVWGQLPLPQVDDQLGVQDKMRILSASMMITNTTALVSRGGEVAGVQLDDGTDWRAYRTFGDVQELAGCWTADAVNGIYGFLKPKNLEELNYFTEFTQQSGFFALSELPSCSDAAFEIIPTTSYLCLSISVSQTASSGYAALVTLGFQVETITKSQWAERKVASHAPGQVQLAAQAISEIGQFHENPFHLSDIWDGIKEFVSGVANGIMKYGPMAIQAAEVLAPLLI